MLIRIMFAPWLTPYPRLTGVLKGINRAGLTTTRSAKNSRNSVLKTRYAHISGKAERDGRQAHTPRRQTTLKRFLDDDDFAKEVLVTVNGKIKLSKEYCPYTAKNISSVKLVSDKESIVKEVTKISFRTGINPQGKTAWKIIFHF